MTDQEKITALRRDLQLWRSTVSILIPLLVERNLPETARILTCDMNRTSELLEQTL